MDDFFLKNFLLEFFKSPIWCQFEYLILYLAYEVMNMWIRRVDNLLVVAKNSEFDFIWKCEYDKEGKRLCTTQ
ncbi:hypothetical protein HMPREF0530_0071 [Lacticaseibacillus paracasei subsp. paracasei ATCC 25302 = DSM 5622 = JCM 8130]|nr:hypothetical protein HMPREF0530_0071 [Lacticaseibacillus paracasei subsp. paracasei ATCC 25302 = DSM 5622 = JCM 8130]